MSKQPLKARSVPRSSERRSGEKAAGRAAPTARPKAPSSRSERAAERRAAIVEAALAEFVARGFTATRLDDIARRAGVAKGTIYLHFKDKESMFEELIRTAIVPLLGNLAGPPPAGASIRDALEGFARAFIQEVATTPRGDIVRLIIAEGPRFPAIADFYYREVISRGLAGIRVLIELAIARGEIREEELSRFPQLLIAPAIVAVVWKSLFEGHAPLDAIEMFRVHLDLIFGKRSAT